MQWYSIFSWGLIQTTLRASTPIIFAALAAVLSQNAGILNVGIEGGMLVSALTAIMANVGSGSWLVGVLVGIVSAEIYSAVIAAAHLKFNANVFAVGSIMNIFALSLTGFIINTVYGVSGQFVPESLALIPNVRFVLLENNAVLNAAINDMSLFVYVAILSVIIVYFLLYKTIWGLRARSSGLYSNAALTAGFNPTKKKMEAIMLSGIFIGLGGAFMSTSYVSMFVEDMISGRGFMGIAAMFFGNANPVFSTIGCIIFGFADSLGSKLQYMGIPTQFVQMIPYIMTVAIYSFSMYYMIKKKQKEKRAFVNKTERK